jgi:hypothetical protein
MAVLVRRKMFISKNDLHGLLMAIALARIEEAEQDRSMTPRCEKVTGKDIEGQLRAMLKAGDEVLIEAIKNCDSQTFNLIQEANAELLTYVILRDGVFVDDRAEKHHVRPEIWINPVNGQPVLPNGVEGLRRAIEFAVNTLLPEKMECWRRPRIEPGMTICRF